MFSALQGLFTHILEQFVDIGTDKLATHHEEKRTQKQLEKVDEQTRAYMEQHLQAVDYEAIDAYLAKQGFYSSGHLEYTSLWEQMVQESIDDFCTKNPNKSVMIKELTPVLRQALERSFKVLFDHLSLGERLLVLQGDLQARKNQRGLKDIVDHLEQNRQILFPEQVERICLEVNKAIDSGSLPVAKSCLELMASQVDQKERYRWTASRIRLDAFLHGSGNAYHFCDRFLEESPDQSVAEELATFLISMDDFSSLEAICPVIQSASKRELLNLILTRDMDTFLSFFFDSERCLKPEYSQNEWVLWALGNAALTRGDGHAALSCYQLIEECGNISPWLRWKKSCARFWNAYFSLSFHTESIDNAEMHSIMQEMLDLSPLFEQAGDGLLSQYIDLLFTCTAAIPDEQAKFPWDHLSERAKQLPISKKYRYQEQLKVWKSIDADELRGFCQNQKFNDLWANYLIRRSEEDSAYVISELESNPELFQETFLYTIAYAHAVRLREGIDAALEKVKHLRLPKDDEISKAIFLAQISACFQSPQAPVLLNQAFEMAIPQPGDHIYPGDIGTLVQLLLQSGREQDALTVSERYQSISPSAGKVCLELMLKQDGMEDACAKLIEELSNPLHDDPFLWYCQGVLREKEYPGTGCDYFQKSFDRDPGLYNATALLTARINRHDAKKDRALEFCEQQEDVHSQYLCSRAYLQMGNREQGIRCMLRGLLLCGSTVCNDLFLDYVNAQLLSPGHDTPPVMVEGDMAVVLTNQENGSIRRLWLHNDASVIPASGSDFAGYEHISADTPAAVLLFHRRKGDIICLDDGQTYSITAINHGDMVALKYCTDYLIQNGQITAGTISSNDPQGSIAEILSYLESGKDCLRHIKGLYASRNPGLTLNMLRSCIGRPYYEAIQGIFWDQSIPFWAGNDHSRLHGNCLLTGSTLAVLGSLGLYPPKRPCPELTFWMTPLTLREVIDEISHFQQSPTPAGSLGRDENGQTYFIENTEEFQSIQRSFYACIRSWCNYSQKTEEVAPEDYPEELRKVQKALHSSEVEAVTLARSAPYVILSDDLIFRQYLHANDIPNASAAEVLAEIAPDPETLLQSMELLYHCNYRDPITPGLLQALSQFFDTSSDEEALANISERSIPLIKRYVNDPLARYVLLVAMRHLLQEKFHFHVTLLWIIERTLQLFNKSHPELQSSEPDEASS